MSLKLLYHGPLWVGSTSLQRLQAFQQLDGVTAVGHDTGARVGEATQLWYRNFLHRVRWKLRWPIDAFDENRRLISVVLVERPDVVVVDNSKVISRSTLQVLRNIGVRRLVYYTPDDIIGKHNLSFPLKRSLPDWDIVFTTKTFNLPELRDLAVRRPILVGKSYDPNLHHPLDPIDVGPEHEKFDVVFVGTFERERCASLNAVAEAGFSVVVYGSDKGGWRREQMRSSIELRKSVFAHDYCVAWHTGKVALCFLRKLNRDRITQRSLEIAAMARPMVAERTDEHSQHFVEGTEYLGFGVDGELVEQVRLLLGDQALRQAMGRAIRRRCETSGYSTLDRARQMISEMER